MKSTNFSAFWLYLSNTFLWAASILALGTLVNLRTSSPVPAKPTENKAPAVAPIVVSIDVLFGSKFAFSPNWNVVENTNGVASVAVAPTFRSDAILAFNLLYCKFLPRFNLIEFTTPLPSLPHPNGIKSSQGSATIIFTSSAPNSLGFCFTIFPTSLMSIFIGPSSRR